MTAGGKELVTQLYDPDNYPPSYEDYLKGRQTQFPKSVEFVEGGKRIVQWDIYVDVSI